MTSAPHSHAVLSNQPPSTPSNAMPASGPLVTKAFCDKMILRSELRIADVIGIAASNHLAADKLLAQIGSQIRSGIKASSGLGFSSQRKPTPGYDAAQIRLGPNNSPVSFGVSRYKKDAPSIAFRWEFNPAHLGPNGLQNLETIWDGLVCEVVPFDLILRKAKVLGLDVAIDLIGVGLCDVLLVGRSKKSSLVPVGIAGKWSMFRGASGPVETVSQLSSGTKPKPVVIAYNKSQELVDKGGMPQFGEQPHTRIERRLRRQTKSLADLGKHANPFAAVGIVDLRSACPAGAPMWRLFVDSARIQGADQALSFVPVAQQALWRDALDKAPDATWWPRSQLFEGWGQSLTDQGLAGWIARASQTSPKLTASDKATAEKADVGAVTTGNL